MAVELRGHVERLGTDRAAALLRMVVADLEPILAGRVQPPRAGMRLLRQTPA
jgi:hypothetical protein